MKLFSALTWFLKDPARARAVARAMSAAQSGKARLEKVRVAALHALLLPVKEDLKPLSKRLARLKRRLRDLNERLDEMNLK